MMNLSSAAGGSSSDPGRGQVRPPGIWAPTTESSSPGRTRRTPSATFRPRRLAPHIGPSFFGWLAAVGVASLLVSLLAGSGVAVELAAGQAAREATAPSGAGSGTGAIEVAGAVALAATLLVAYFCGGYVASRMARSSGARQGLAVWLWGVVVAAVLAVLAAVAGARYNVLMHLNLPRIPVDEGTLTAGGIAALVVGLLASLAGALLGGAVGVRHRR